MNQYNYKIDILVNSCDLYSDVWPHFFKCFFDNWENCPLDIYLLSNSTSYNDKRIINYKIGEDKSWSDNLLEGLKKINNEYVMLLIDDLLINKKISNDYFYQISEWININNPDYLRLHISTKPQKYDSLVGKIPKKSPYKTSTMPCIWKKNTLEKILKKGESAWEFESLGSERAYVYNNFFSVYKNFISYDNSIIKGKWQRPLALKLKINNSSRSTMSNFNQMIYNLKVARSKFFNYLPNNIRNFFKK